MKRRPRSTASALAILLAGAGLVTSDTGIAEEQPTAIAAADTPGQPGQVPSSNPLSGDREAIVLGKRLFSTWCAPCHGAKADGGGQHSYGANLTVFALGYKAFLVTVKNGRVQKQMPPWKDVLDDDAINKIGAYLETLAQPGANWQ
jgi:mono/diheme cytochrome c family protein